MPQSTVSDSVIHDGRQLCVEVQATTVGSVDDDMNTATTQSSLDEDVQMQLLPGHTEDRSDISEMLIVDNALGRKQDCTAEIVKIDNFRSVTHAQPAKTGDRQVQRSERIDPALSEREALIMQPESLPLEIPTGGPTLPSNSAQVIANVRDHDEHVAATSLVPAVSQSAKTALTTHSSATEPHANRTREVGGGDNLPVPCQVDARSGSTVVPPTPPPNDVVATWEKALAAMLASSNYSSTLPMETLSSGWSSVHAINSSSLQLPPSRISGVMCRSHDAVQFESIPAHTEGVDPGVNFGFDPPSKPVKAWFLLSSGYDVEDHKPPKSHRGYGGKKQQKNCGRFAAFAVIVSFVAGITIVGALLASRAPASSSNGLAPTGSCNRMDALPLVMQTINTNSTQTRYLQEWRSSSSGGSAFGEFVGLSEDGSVIAITERVSGGASVVYVIPAASPAGGNTSMLSVEATITSLSLSRDGSLIAVGLANGLAEVYSRDPTCKTQWTRLGDSIRQDGSASLRQLSTQANYTTSVSISGDGSVVAVGLVTSLNAAHYQVLRLSNGLWQPKGPAIEYGDDGSFVHSSAKVSLSPSCTSTSSLPCILAISRLFSYKQFSFGIISVLQLRKDEDSWDTLGQAIPFGVAEAKVGFACNGSRLAVSDATSTTVYRLTASSNGTRDEWTQLGQIDLPGSDAALDESGERLAVSENSTIIVYDLQPASNSSNGSAAAYYWGEGHQIPIHSPANEEGLDDSRSQVRLAIGHHGDRVVVGEPYFSSSRGQSISPRGRVLLMGF